MKGIARTVAGSIVLALLGAICLAAGMLDRRVAGAQREFAAQRYELADASLGGCCRRHASLMPHDRAASENPKGFGRVGQASG